MVKRGQLLPLFPPEPHRECTRPKNAEYAGPHRDLGATHGELQLKEESQQVEHRND